MSEEISSFIDNLIHRATQERGNEFDLTVNEIYEVRMAGRVDFGGSELSEPELSPYDKVKRNEDDRYGWWNLGPGQYLMEYNEDLKDLGDKTAVIQTRDELLKMGASHPTLELKELKKVPLNVGGAGIKIKENARVTTLKIK